MIQGDIKNKTGIHTRDDLDLVRQVQRGDLDAFNRLYEKHLPKVYSRVCYVVPSQDVDDVTQEVFIAMMKSVKKFRGDAKFSTWLRTLTNRQVANYYRRRNRGSKEDDLELSSVDYRLTGELGDNQVRIDNVIMVRQAMRHLPDHYREILLLRFAEGLRFEEIARLDGKTLEATKSLFRRAIAALRAQFGETNA